MKEKLECEESDEVVRRCQKWREDMESRFPKRKASKVMELVYEYLST